jgi:YVTN family beta-propeller protein
LSGVNVTFAGWMGVRNAAPGGTCTSVAANAFTRMWCNGTTGTPVATNTDGAMSSPASVWGDGTNLYVADTGNHRVSRYTKTTAVPTGWLGLVRTQPSGGDPGCASTMPFAATPGWCVDGISAAGHGIGMFTSPQEVIGDGTNLYVADQGNNRVVVINASSGVASGFVGAQSQPQTGWAAGSSLLNAASASAGSYDDAAVDTSYGIASDGTDLYYTEYYGHRVKKLSKNSGTATGWVGKTLMPPSGGATGCSTTAPTALAQNWCLGGSASSGNSDGQFNNPAGVYLNGNYAYVSDYTNNRIVRYTKDGAAAGWIGLISTSPIGGDINCAGASAGTYTLGWCVGGTATAATATVGFKDPMGITGDGTNLYITEPGIGRIQKVRISDGAQLGWIGKLSAVPAPAGGVTGCTAVAANAATPGWCTGGNISATGAGDNMFNNPWMVFHDAGYLYIADTTNHRVARVNASTGATGGWIGKAGASAPVCPAGFTGVANGTNPTWCTGGTTASSGSTVAQFNSPRGIWADGTSLYVTESGNARVQKFKQSDGTFVGWYGRAATASLTGPAGCSLVTVNSVTPNWCTSGTAKAGPMLGAFDSLFSVTGDANWIYVTDITQNRVVRIRP